MPENATCIARQAAAAHEINRLERRIGTVNNASILVSWVRVAVLCIGIAAGIAAGTQVSDRLGWGAIAATLVIFAIVVAYHRYLERWIETFKIWREMRADQLARMNIEWDRLPRALGIPASSPIGLDLDLIGPRSLHQLLDTTNSRQGSQRLAEWLTQTRPELERTLSRQRVVRELLSSSRFRDRFRLIFRLGMPDQLEGESLTHWLGIEYHSRRLRWILVLGAVLVAVNLSLFALNVWGGLPAFWIAPLVAYAALYFFGQDSLNPVLAALVRLDTELDRFSAMLRFLETHSYAGRDGLAGLCAPFRDARHLPSRFLRRIKLVTIGVGLRTNIVMRFLLNLILPWDFVAAFLADRYRGQIAQSFPIWLDTCYELDALIALANFGYCNPGYVFPEITPDAHPVFRAEGLGHPLIPEERQVRNDYAIDGPGEIAIITGSNMAGKSTFIKTVGINLCLAYAGAPVSATGFRSAPFRLHSCIRINDSVVDGFSHFYAEVKCLKRLLELLRSDDPLPLLYVIDEIFRGTNNRERLQGSRSYIRALLGADGVGLLATHDLELAKLEGESSLVHNYHFRDQVQDGKLVFDYKIHPGPSTTTNALKIMQMEGLPVEPEDTERPASGDGDRG